MHIRAGDLTQIVKKEILGNSAVTDGHNLRSSVDYYVVFAEFSYFPKLTESIGTELLTLSDSEPLTR